MNQAGNGSTSVNSAQEKASCPFRIPPDLFMWNTCARGADRPHSCSWQTRENEQATFRTLWDQTVAPLHLSETLRGSFFGFQQVPRPDYLGFWKYFLASSKLTILSLMQSSVSTSPVLKSAILQQIAVRFDQVWCLPLRLRVLKVAGKNLAATTSEKGAWSARTRAAQTQRYLIPLLFDRSCQESSDKKCLSPLSAENSF